MSSSVLNHSSSLRYGNENNAYRSVNQPIQDQMKRLVKTPVPTEPKAEPLSGGFINKLVYITATVLVLVACFYGFAIAFGDDISRGGHSVSQTRLNITIGSDRLSIPANSVRFDYQRQTGTTDNLELYLHWPSLSGYTDSLKTEFNKSMNRADLVFLSLEKRNMTFDMSGRVEPIYKRFFVGSGNQTGFGLVQQPLSATDGFIDEDLYYAADSPYPYATRCVREKSKVATPFCIRDIHIGRDLTLTYRFHKRFLPQWIELDQAIRAHAKSLITNL